MTDQTPDSQPAPSESKTRLELHTVSDVLKSMVGRLVTMVNPQSLEGAPVGYRLTTGFYKAKIRAVEPEMLTVATEFTPHRAEKEPVKQFIPINSVKRISVMKQEIMIHL